MGGCIMNDQDERYIVPALRRGLAILGLFNRDRRTLSLPEITRELQLPRGTAFRLVHTLEAEGYLQRTPAANAFQLGLNVLTLGFEFIGSLDLVDVARPVLESLRDGADASTHLAILDGWDVVYLISVSSRHRITGNLVIGTRMPADRSSIGHALLFGATAHDIFARAKAGGATFSDDQAGKLAEAVFEAEKRGYVLFRGLYVPGITSIAAPVRDAEGCIVAGVNVSDYENVPSLAKAEDKLASKVVAAAEQISRRLGYRPRP